MNSSAVTLLAAAGLSGDGRLIAIRPTDMFEMLLRETFVTWALPRS
jgi:hypothetical protein